MKVLERETSVATAASPANESLSGAQVVLQCLRRSGVTTIFGQSIPSAILQLAPHYGITQVGYRTENAGGVMADGYARVSGQLGVVAAQNGPAATLLVAPLAEALKASVPLLAIVQDVSRAHAGRNAFQELDHMALFQGCTKWCARAERLDTLEDLIDTAIRQAVSGRPGPVALMLPMDLLREKTTRGLRRNGTSASYPWARSVASCASIATASSMLTSARQPLIVAGGGVHISGAYDALARLQHEFQLPVATTNMGKGAVADTHALSIGVIGNCMGASAPSHGMRGYVRAADVVLLAGTRTNQNGTDSWRLFNPDARFIHIDVDPAEIGRNYDSVALVGDLRETLLALGNALQSHGWTSPGNPSVSIAASRAQATQDFLKRTRRDSKGMRPEAVMHCLSQMLPDDAIVAADASYSTNWVASYLATKKTGDRFLLPRGLAGLGWGLPLAMGAKVARPNSLVVAVVGDGGFGHCWSELEAASRQGIHVVTIVLNNGILGYQKHAEDMEYGSSTDACDFLSVDHAAIARACGCAGYTVRSNAELADALGRSIEEKRPAVVDVVTDPEAKPPLTIFESAT